MASAAATTTASTAGGSGDGGDMIRWGILGTAAIAHKVVAAINDAPGCVAAAVASRDLGRAQKWATEHEASKGAMKAYGNYDEMLADKTLDVIYIPVPTAVKTEWAIKVAEAGKSMVLEKPLPGDDVKELESIVAACKKNNVQFFDGSMWQHSVRTKDILAVKDKVGDLRTITAAFTFNPQNDTWLNGGNGRTDKTREPWGCFGDQGWYPLSAIMFAVDYALPSRVQMAVTTLNTVDTVVAGGGVLWWDDGKWATFDYGATTAHRSCYTMAGALGAITVEDLVGGQGKSGNFSAYAEHFTGSDYFKMDDVKGKESVVKCEPCNHTVEMIKDMNACSAAIKAGGAPEERWPKAALVTHQVMSALWRSFEADHAVVKL